MKYERLRKFRQETYQMLGKAHDAAFELSDSVMTTRNADCLGEFSLSPLFRRISIAGVIFTWLHHCGMLFSIALILLRLSQKYKLIALLGKFPVGGGFH